MKRDVHDVIGGLAGLAASLAASRGEPIEYRIIEAAGGYCAGVLASRIPDVLEPAMVAGPSHRSAFHSVAALAVAGKGTWSATLTPTEITRGLRARSAEWERRAAEQPTELRRFGGLLLAVLLRMAAGAVAGLPVGYASHLVLDAVTPNSLPLVKRGF